MQLEAIGQARQGVQAGRMHKNSGEHLSSFNLLYNPRARPPFFFPLLFFFLSL